MSAEGNPWPAIGQLFVEQGRLSRAQLDQALAIQEQTGQQLGEILVSSGLISRLDLASAIGTQWAYQERTAEEPAAPQPEYAEPEPLSPFAANPLAAAVEVAQPEYAQPEYAQPVEYAHPEYAQPVAQPEYAQPVAPPQSYEVEQAAWAAAPAADPELAGRLEALEEKARLVDDLQARLRSVYEQLAAAEARVETLEPLVARLSEANEALSVQLEAQTREFEELRSNAVKVEALATALRAFFS